MTVSKGLPAFNGIWEQPDYRIDSGWRGSSPPDRPVTNASQVNVAQFDAEARHFADMAHGPRARLTTVFGGQHISALRRSHFIEVMRRIALVDVGFCDLSSVR